MEDFRYSFTIRTPAVQARADRARRIRRVALIGALVAALLTPGVVDELAPSVCAHVWVC